MLLGRRVQQGRIDHLLAHARAGRGGSLVVRGPPGAGKSALLQYAASAAGDMLVLRASGVQAEHDLPFAVLHQLLRPAFDLVRRLPTPQREALEGALALGPATGADRFVVAAGVLTLLAESAEDDGLVAVVDDAQWIDQPSLDALLFATRRLDADRLALLLAVREGEEQGLARSGVEVVDIAGLGLADAATLVSRRAGVPVADAVMTRLMQVTGGNPLALTELATLLDPAEVAGREPLTEPLPVSAGMEQAFLTRARSLPEPTQLLLLVAAAEGTGDLAAVLSAAERMQVPRDELPSAEAAGLLTITDGTLAFRHPLVRSALYGAAEAAQRRAVHAALAAVLTGESDVDRRTWHRGAAALAPDDQVADDLAASAERARMRSGHAGAAGSLRRSAALTSDPDVRARRLIDSAQEAWLAGKADLMLACLDEARQLTSDLGLADQIRRLSARYELHRGTATEAFQLFLDGALAAQEREPDVAVEMFAEASEAALYVGDIAGMVRAGQLARDVAVTDRGRFWRDFCVGVAEVLDGHIDLAEPLLRRVIGESGSSTEPWRLVSGGIAAVWLGDQATAIALYEQAARAARVADMTGNLPYVLEYLAAAERTRGRYATSQGISEEGLRLSQETGQETSVCNHHSNLAHLAALAGDEAGCLRHAEEALRRALPRRLGFPAARAALAVAVLDLGAGRYSESLRRMTELAAAGPGVGHPAIVMFSLPDRIEAAVRCGDLAAAAEALEQLERWNIRTGPAARAVMSRCRALLAPDDAAAPLYAQAMQLHEQGRSPQPEVARTQLLYGEWLRRARRPAESRQYLRAAMENFDRLGARPWAERARLELKASGETLRRPRTGSAVRLTPQELRIVRAVATGSSTKEIAALLFVSPRTVEYHLHKVFAKLGISSRTDLVRLVVRDASLVEG
jgi:DNA-binding CsgD family transcriptional regulator